MNSLGFCCWCFLLSKLSDSFSSYSFSFFVFLHLARLYDGEDSRRRRTDCTTQKYLLLLFFFSFLISTTTIISTITKKSIKLTKRLMNLQSLSLSVCWFKSSDNFHYNLSIWWQFFVCCFFLYNERWILWSSQNAPTFYQHTTLDLNFYFNFSFQNYNKTKNTSNHLVLLLLLLILIFFFLLNLD